MHQTLKLGSSDDVVVALKPVAAGQSLNGLHLIASTDIPAGHKLAIHSIAPGQPVRKFNQIIGFATQPIAVGELVHTHNLVTGDFERDYAIGTESHSIEPIRPPATFQGIVRPNGRVGTRNYVGILTTVNCSATVARRIAAHFTPEVLSAYPNVDGVVAITHGTGCGMAEHGEPADLLRRVFVGYATHANFAGVLLLGLGCETNQIEPLINLTSPSGLNSPNGLTGHASTLRTSTIQEEGGTALSIQKGITTVYEMLEQANHATRTTVSASNLVLGLQCGGSDAYSGISANPALGAAVDILVRNGGTAILSETPEIYGAEHLLTRRAATPEIGHKLVERIRWWEDYCARNGGEMNNNPSPGNKAGGLTTILEKSLGAAAKGGTTALNEVYEYAEPVTAKGFVFMDTPGYDPVSATGQVAGGANVLAFTTGRGSAYGCKPTPSVKLATNNDTYRRMVEDMDINCGDVVDGVSIADKGREIFDKILAVASGERTKSELLGYGDAEFTPWQIGATM